MFQNGHGHPFHVEYKDEIEEVWLAEEDEVVNEECFIFESGDDVSSFIKIIKHVEKALLATDVRFIFWFDVWYILFIHRLNTISFYTLSSFGTPVQNLWLFCFVHHFV